MRKGAAAVIGRNLSPDSGPSGDDVFYGGAIAEVMGGGSGQVAGASTQNYTSAPDTPGSSNGALSNNCCNEEMPAEAQYAVAGSGNGNNGTNNSVVNSSNSNNAENEGNNEPGQRGQLVCRSGS